MLAASVLIDSALEHFRGAYSDRLMYVAPVTAATTIAAALARRLPSAVRSSIFGGAFVVGLSGLGFHLYNVLKRPGGFSWNNLFYAAPIAAPGALLLSGMLGFAGERIEHGEPHARSSSRFGELGRALCFAVSGGIVDTVSEVALLHFRGAYQNPFMYAPVTIPPLTAAALVMAGARPTPRVRRTAQWMLKLTAALGLIGSAFHVYGVQRSMGGWRNWKQNLFAGPPIPAPPGFTGLALAGLGAIRLLEDSHRRSSHL